MVQKGEIAEMRASLKGSANDMNSSGSVTSSVMPPQMNAGNSEVDFEEDDVPMPFVGSMIKKVAASPEDEQGMMPG
jgi:hypothetical protein